MSQFAPATRPVILVVEDEPILRMMAADLVEEAGFDVLEAASADEVLKILAARTDIRIVFTDIDMPGSMDGLKLATAIRGRWPPIELIVTSGHHDGANVMLPARGVFFPKPYDRAKVMATMRSMAA